MSTLKTLHERQRSLTTQLTKLEDSQRKMAGLVLTEQTKTDGLSGKLELFSSFRIAQEVHSNSVKTSLQSCQDALERITQQMESNQQSCAADIQGS